MPRAFLITHRRYNGPEEFAETLQDYSPERGVRLAEYGGGQPTSDGVSDCGSETSSECPEELYNLTKLAEVSLAAAAGTLIHPDNLLRQRSLSPTRPNDRYRLGPAASSKHQYHQQPQHQQHHQYHHRHHHQHPHQYHNHEEIRLEHHAYHRNGFQRQVHQHGHHTSCQQQQQQQQQQQRDEQEYETLRKPPTIEDVTLRERSRLFFERIEREREILEGVPRDSEKKLPSSEKEIKRGCPPAAAPSEKASAVLPGAAQPTSGRVTAAVQAESSKACGEDNEEHECPDCGKKYSTSSNLARHRQTHRSLGDKKARRCPHCDKVYVSMPAYSMHVRTHNQGCKCHYCGKCFSRPWLLQGHIRTHTGEKPFKCTICNKAFADKSNLRAHIQTHSNTKPHVCTRCGKAFALKSYLYKHEESSCMRAHQRTSTEKREASSERSLAFASSSASPASTAATSSTTTTTMTPATITQNSTSINTRLGSAARAQVDSEMNQRERSGPSVIVPRQGLSDPFVDLRRAAETSGKTLRPSAFSAIIKHTKLSQHQYQQPRQLEEEEEKDDGQEREPTLPKRRCREPNTRDSTCLNKMAEISRTKEASKMTSKESPESTKSKSKIEASDSDEQSEYLSRMVIRTSVISPNPEHLGRLSSLVGKNSTTFDLIEPSRTSRISLNLAIG